MQEIQEEGRRAATHLNFGFLQKNQKQPFKGVEGSDVEPSLDSCGLHMCSEGGRTPQRPVRSATYRRVAFRQVGRCHHNGPAGQCRLVERQADKVPSEARNLPEMSPQGAIAARDQTPLRTPYPTPQQRPSWRSCRDSHTTASRATLPRSNEARQFVLDYSAGSIWVRRCFAAGRPHAPPSMAAAVRAP